MDTLIAAGIGGSRAEILRWAVSSIREHPAYAQLQDRVMPRVPRDPSGSAVTSGLLPAAGPR